MVPRSLCHALSGLLLSLALLLGLLAVPAGAVSSSPPAALSGIGYYGTYRTCIMPYDMAQAYAVRVKALPAGTPVLLADPAGDGMPLLITARGNEFDNWDIAQIVTWDGTRAQVYDLDSDLECGYSFGYTFGTYRGEPALHVGDGLALAVGDVSGDLYYRVQNAQLTRLRHEMYYSAYSYHSAMATGETLPLVQTTYMDGVATASRADLIAAGWLYDPDSQAFSLIKVDETFQFFSSLSEHEAWLQANQGSRFFSPAASQIIEVTTGSSGLLGTWSTPAAMANALTAYAQQAAAAQGLFVDVPTTHYACDAVHWAVEQKITNGTSTGTFSPDQTCTTGQILTFLWRANRVSPSSGDAPFSDVSAGSYVYQPALWAYAQGLVSGSRLNPDQPCTRAQAALYLWKLAGSPSVHPMTSFTDVDPQADYAQAVAWAVQVGITNGTSQTAFSPNKTCTRAQIVTFLFPSL